MFNRMCIRAGIRIQRNRIKNQGKVEEYEQKALQAAVDVEKYLDVLEEKLDR